MSLRFTADKKSRKGEKRKEKMIYNGKKTEHCNTRTHEVIRRNFEKSRGSKKFFLKFLIALGLYDRLATLFGKFSV